jgi:hypothetical protein
MAMIPNVNAAASNAAMTQSKIVGKPFFRDMTLQRSPANGGAELEIQMRTLVTSGNPHARRVDLYPLSATGQMLGWAIFL